MTYRDSAGTLDLPLPGLPGRHQALNAALAVAMLRHQQALPISDAALRGTARRGGPGGCSCSARAR